MASGKSARAYRPVIMLGVIVEFILIGSIGLAESIKQDQLEWVPVKTTLPKPQFVGTEKNIRVPRVRPVQTEAGPPFLAPAGTQNVALGKPVTSSDPEPIIGELAFITDGDKEASDGSYVELGPLLQHITIDLQAQHTIYGIRVWHYHLEPRVYFDVIVQVSNDPNFTTGVKTIFNNDMDNSAGLGTGNEMHYVDTRFGLLVDARGVSARYVRLYSNGNTTNDINHYIEVEVYGKPTTEADKLVPLKIKLPKPMFVSHRSADFMDHIPNLEPLSWAPRPALMVPPGLTNVALHKPVVSSDMNPIIGRLEMITDGNKESRDNALVELGPGLQHITIDLGQRCQNYAVALWHSYRQPRAYWDVIVQVADDPNFKTNVHEIFNNDHDNSAGLGKGPDKNYIDIFRGKVIPVNGICGRFIRLYSHGNDVNVLNHYLEVEVYGKPIK